MAVQYVGSKISLMSKAQIRYEGILHSVNRDDSTITLSQVQSLGTEDRPAAQHVAPRNDIFEFIIFKADDIAELTVCEPPQFQDPAIVSTGKTAPVPPTPAFNQLPSNRTPGAIGEKSRAPVPPMVPAPLSGPPTSYRNAAATGVAPPRQAVQPYQQLPQRQQGPGRGGMADSRGGRGGGAVDARGGRGGAAGFRGGSAPDPRAFGGHVWYNNRGRGAPPQGAHRGNFRGTARGRGGAMRPPEKLKFDTEYDFSEANEEFEKQFKEMKLHDSTSEDAGDEVEEVNGDNTNGECYDKTKSFFDSISCDAKERSEGKDIRPNWKAERQVNTETFGQAAVRYSDYRGRFRGRGRGGFYRGRGGAPQSNRQ